MDQTRAKNQWTQPPTYAASAANSLTQALLLEPSIKPEVFAAYNSNITPDNLSLPGRETHLVFSDIHNPKSQIFSD